MTNARTTPVGPHQPFLFASSGWCGMRNNPDMAQRLLIIHDPAAEEWRVERETMEWAAHEGRFSHSAHIIAAYGYYTFPPAPAAPNRTHEEACSRSLAKFTELQHWREFAERRGA